MSYGIKASLPFTFLLHPENPHVLRTPAAREPPKDRWWSGKGLRCFDDFRCRRWRSCCFVVAQTNSHRGFSRGCRTSSDLCPFVRSLKFEERVPVVLQSSHMWDCESPWRPSIRLLSIILPTTFVHPLKYIWSGTEEMGEGASSCSLRNDRKDQRSSTSSLSSFVFSTVHDKRPFFVERVGTPLTAAAWIVSFPVRALTLNYMMFCEIHMYRCAYTYNRKFCI